MGAEFDAAATPRAFDQVLREQQSMVFSIAYHFLRERAAAEEVAQDVLLKVYQKIDAFRGDAALSSWIYRITFNAAMSRLR